MRTRNVLYSYDIFLLIIDPFVFIIQAIPTLFYAVSTFLPSTSRMDWTDLGFIHDFFTLHRMPRVRDCIPFAVVSKL